MNRIKGLSLLSVLYVAMLGNAVAADLKTPDKVKDALRMLAYVQDDMARKMPTKAYARLPHENEEFQEAAPALRDAIAAEPADFRARVDAQLKVAQTAASNMAEISKSNDEERIMAAIAAVDAALKKVDALFPEALRPVPGQLGSGPGGRGQGGPPKDLR